MEEPLIQISDFKGGMTLNEKMGRQDQFHIGKNLDFSSKPGYLSVGLDLGYVTFIDSANAPTEFPWIVSAGKDGNIYFGGDDGAIYNASGNSLHSDTVGIKGMAEYKDYLYWARDTTLGRYDFSGTWTDGWQTGLTDADYHPMKVMGGKLYIGHGQYLASYDGTTFTSTALDLADNWQIRCLDNFGYLYLAIGASYYTSSGTPVKSKIFLWNRESSSWNDEIIIPEAEINAMVYTAGYLWIWAGRSCNIYVVPEGSRQATKIWSFTREEPAEEFEVYPGAVMARRGTVYFGLSDVGSNSYEKNPAGIYSFPAEPDKFSLNLIYYKNGYKERYKGIANHYGVSGIDTMYFSFRDYIIAGSEYNKLHYEKSTNYGDGWYYSFQYSAPPNKKISTEAFIVEFEPLPSNCQISLYAARKEDTTSGGVGKWFTHPTGWTTIFENFSTADATKKVVRKRLDTEALQLKLLIQGDSSSLNRPFIKSIVVTGHLYDKSD